ncbi:MAG: anthranilate synthase component I family protein, partial [Candidatus Korobacteraceae bacterium]
MSAVWPASFEQFRAAAASGNTVPVVRTVPADLITPLAAYLRLARNSRHSFLLESVEGGAQLARYSFLGAEPEAVIRSKNNATRVIDADGERVLPVNAIEYLRECFRARVLTRDYSGAPFAGGAVGFLSYGAAKWFEPILGDLPAEADDAAFMLFRTVLAFDHAKQVVEIRTLAFIDGASTPATATSALAGDPGAGGDTELRTLYESALAELERVAQVLAAPLAIDPAPSAAVSAGKSSRQFGSNFQRAEFEQAVRDVKELIAAGETYQTVLSQRFSRPVAADAVSLYRALRRTNPSPYMYLLQLGDEALIGASPEMLVRCTGRRLEYRPIAGTRKRGRSDAEDQLLAEEMLADEKERAEHLMLVDLGRNDLGRVAEYGTVQVDKLMRVEKYSHVQHIVTELSAQLRPELDRFDALAACFPAGTVTGAPKIRSMQAIATLERGSRNVYSGSVLYADYAGNLDSCIAIRTIELRDGVASVQAGAGIVADSVPELEY